jgi:hypothetical protein
MPQRQTTRRIASDEVQGEGSYVTLRAMSYGFVRDAGRQAVFDSDGKPRTDASLDEQLKVFDKLIIDSIVEWNWVDDKGEPLPVPTVSDDLDRLMNTEIKFLMDHIKLRGDKDTKNSVSG